MSIEGAVSLPYVLVLSDAEADTVTITAELRGSTMTIPARDYTGWLLREIIERANPSHEVTGLRVIASDGYEIELAWDAVQSDEELLLILEDGNVRLVAAAYDGAYWVQQVRRIVVK